MFKGYALECSRRMVFCGVSMGKVDVAEWRSATLLSEFVSVKYVSTLASPSSSVCSTQVRIAEARRASMAY